MTSASTSSGGSTWRDEHRALLNWRGAFFSSIAPDARSRAGSDGVRLIVAVFLYLITTVVVHANPSFERWWVNLAVPPPSGLAWVLTSLFIAGIAGAGVLLVVFALLVRRRDLTLDLVVGFATGYLVSVLLQHLLGVAGGRPVERVFDHVNVGFPDPVLVAVIAMSIVGRPYFSRGVRHFESVLIVAAVAGAVTTGRALPLTLVGSLVLALVSASAVRLWLGRPHVGVSPDAVVEALAPLGFVATTASLHPADVGRAAHHVPEWGVERVFATTDNSVPLRISVYGRDSRDAELLSSLWRELSTKQSGVSPFLGRQQQAEHEALTIATLHQITDGHSPRLEGVTATTTTHDVLVVASMPVGTTLRARHESGTVSPAEMRSVVALVKRAHTHRVALGVVDLDHVALTESGEAIIEETLQSVLNATVSARREDIAALLVVFALLSDVDVAVATVSDAFGTDELVATLAFLEEAALNASLRRDLKDHKDLLTKLRTAGAATAHVEEPKLVQLRRVSPATLILGVGSLVGGWALIGVFLNVANSISTLKGANWGWVVAVLVLASLTFLASAVVDLGSITGSIPILRLTALEVANSFSGLAIGAVAVVAARVRFLQRQGYDATAALSSGVLSSMSSWIVKGVIFLLALPFAWHSIHLSSSSGKSSHSHLVHDVLVVVIVLAVALAVLFAVPKWRKVVEHRLAPKFHELRTLLKTLATQPRKLVEIFGGTVCEQLVVVLALGAALHAFGAHLPIATLVVILTVGSMVGGASPVPGGVGVVEAGMILGLTAAGVSQPIAVDAVFVQRLFTCYLPPFFGYVTLLWMRRRELL